MRIVVEKYIILPWNYSDKLAVMNNIIDSTGGERLDFVGYIDDIWKYAIENSDDCLKTAQKPNRKS
ncbi:MAG: hypothetical protein J6L69_03865 [Lachnospiraceae bacterium]|nr:hypothetical protein [Lachnospiraceae bacterium]